MREVLSDVLEQFQSLDHIKGVMESWKRKYTSAYNDAFIALSVPSLFAPYVRLQVAQWDPLADPTLDCLPFYNKLFSFGVDDDTPEDDPDWNLVPKLVEKVTTRIMPTESRSHAPPLLPSLQAVFMKKSSLRSGHSQKRLMLYFVHVSTVLSTHRLSCRSAD